MFKGFTFSAMRKRRSNRPRAPWALGRCVPADHAETGSPGPRGRALGNRPYRRRTRRPLACSRRLCRPLCRQRLGPGCVIKTPSSMSEHTPQFCGLPGHTFTESLKGSGDCCQAQRDLDAAQRTVEMHGYSTKKPP